MKKLLKLIHDFKLVIASLCILLISQPTTLTAALAPDLEAAALRKLIIKHTPSRGYKAATSVDAEVFFQIMFETAKKYNLDSTVLFAIAVVESNINLKAINHKTLDYCLMQINRKYNPDAPQLINSLEKCIDRGAKILSKFKRQYKTNYICRYNIGYQNLPKTCKAYTVKIQNVLKSVKLRSESEVYNG